MQRKQFGKRGPAPVTWGDAEPAVAGFSSADSGLTGKTNADDEFSVSYMLASAFRIVFDFQGRTGLYGYWVVGIAYLVVLTILAVTFVLWFGSGLETAEDLQRAMNQPAFYGFAGVYVALCVFRWALEVRRFHDRGVSGFWILTWFIPIIGIPFCVVQYFKNCFFPGTPGQNQFG